MPVLQLDDQKFPLRAGMTRIGSGADADVAVQADPALGVQAVIEGGAAPTIRRAGAAAQVRVNGVLLGAEPTPLMHGDKVEIGGVELHFSDDAKGGATQFVSASEIAAIAGVKRSGVARPTAASGGRVVSLVDGKEYPVADSGLVFGRDAACEVVIAQTEVSRRHADIVPGEQGYLVRDMSANGVFVNGERVQGSHRLARADVVRIGSEEFRFYADVLSAAASAAVAAAPPAAPVSAPPPPPPPRPSSSAASSVAATPPAAKAATQPVGPAAAAPPTPTAEPGRSDPRPVLATLESVNEGPLKGARLELRGPLSHVGRGAHNDVCLSDESVSESHAKIQRREDGWYVVDIDSTNGTYVGGTRVIGERRLDGSPDVRFGGMKFRFTALGIGSAADLDAKGTRAIARVTIGPNAHPTLPPLKATPESNPTVPTPVPASDAPQGGIPAWVWIVVVLVLGGVAFFVLKGRA